MRQGVLQSDSCPWYCLILLHSNECQTVLAKNEMEICVSLIWEEEEEKKTDILATSFLAIIKKIKVDSDNLFLNSPNIRMCWFIIECQRFIHVLVLFHGHAAVSCRLWSECLTVTCSLLSLLRDTHPSSSDRVSSDLNRRNMELYKKACDFTVLCKGFRYLSQLFFSSALMCQYR